MAGFGSDWGCLSGGVTFIHLSKPIHGCLCPCPCPCPCPQPKASDSDASNRQSSMCQFAGSRAPSGRIQLTSGARVDGQVPAWLHSSPVVYTATNKLWCYQESYGRRGCLSNKAYHVPGTISPSNPMANPIGCTPYTRWDRWSTVNQ